MKLPLKADITPTQFWATAIGGILLTALTVLPMLEAAWVGGAVAFLGFGYQLVQSKAKSVEIEKLKAELETLKKQKGQ